MSKQQTSKKKPAFKLPFPVQQVNAANAIDEELAELRPKPERYADRTWMPPRGTRRSMGKR